MQFDIVTVNEETGGGILLPNLITQFYSILFNNLFK